MERKLVKQGRNALTTTLPAYWIKENNLSEKDYVYLEEERGNIIISSNNKKSLTRTKINLKNYNLKLSLYIISGAYLKGYDIIEIYNASTEIEDKIPNLNLFGMIVEVQIENKIILKDMIAKPCDNFDEIFKRSCSLLVRLSQELVKFTENKTTSENIKKTERILDQNLFYCLRYINKYESYKESHKNFLQIATLEQIGDNISELRKYIKTNVELSQQIQILIEDYIASILIKNYVKVFDSVNKFKKIIKKETFEEGYAYSITDTIINYIGYLIEND